MKITAIGTGNAFSEYNFNQSYLLEEGSSKFLIDCGQQVFRALKHHKINTNSITDIYVSHLHSDHIGSLESFAFTRYNWLEHPRDSKDWIRIGDTRPKLIGNEKLIENLWEKSLKGGLESMEGFESSLDTFFNVKRISPNEKFTWEGWDIQLIQQIHIMAGSIISPTFGLFLKKEGHPTLYFTTDSQHCSPAQVEQFYNEADIIFQDCETVPFKSNVHANYIQLAGYPEANSIVLSKEIRNKMWLSHYHDNVTLGVKHLMPNPKIPFYCQEGCKPFDSISFDWEKQAKEDGFQGFVKVGQVFEV